MRIDVSPRRLAGFLAKVIVTLVLLSLLGQLWQHGLGKESFPSLVRLFDLDQEYNVPTAYQGLALLATASMLVVIGRLPSSREAKTGKYWFGLSAMFLFLACDEMFRIHEQVRTTGLVAASDYLREVSPLFRYRWIVYAVPVLAVLGTLYLRFVLRLPPLVRTLTITGGITYVFAAMGLEMVGGILVGSVGRDNATYILLATLEESLEMVGIATFLCALAVVLRDQASVPMLGMQLDFAGKRANGAAATDADTRYGPLPIQRAA